MPSRENPDGTYRDIVHPINSDFRTHLEESIIDAYTRELALAEVAAREEGVSAFSDGVSGIEI
jgi:stage V sporulation protein G